MRIDILFYLVVGGLFILNKTVFEDIRERKREDVKINLCYEFDEYMWSTEELKSKEEFLKVLRISDKNILIAMDANRFLLPLEDIHIRERDRDKIVNKCIDVMDKIIRIRSHF